ncbi:MAG: hypothetical protein FIA96_15250 [Betaproteobacteria bacterium]|nr:hypothetical protein [Betaproteobacteria bacterium]
MKVFIFCTTENIFHPAMFHNILVNHRDEIVGAAIFPGLASTSLARTLNKAYRIDGLGFLPKLVGHYLKNRFHCWFDSPPYYSTVDKVFAVFRLPCYRFDSPNDPAVADLMRQLKVDVIFNNQPRRLGASILTVPTLACINRHTSELPFYRGIEPVFHALRERQPHIGVSIHTMTADYDAGKVIAKVTFSPEKSVYVCYKKAFDLSSELFSQALANLSHNIDFGTICAATTNYYTEPSPQEIREFRQLGWTYF